ncbi:hypothetical protein KJ564_08115 [bacterium]|nr:hypothetical protein [bacterium]MBU1881276.1 hypothetical protein [bacterium]
MKKKRDPEIIAADFAAEMRQAFGQEMQSLFLVGSAARGDFVHGKSDINTVVILTEEGMTWLEKAYPILQTWKHKGIAVPHFMLTDVFDNAQDSYPLEFLDFKCFHKVIMGPDTLSTLIIPREPLRLQIERELRGKLFLLRQIFVAQAGRSKELNAALIKSVSVFTAVFQGILELAGKPIPANRKDLFSYTAEYAGFSDRVFQQILEIRQGQGSKNQRVIFKDLLHVIPEIVHWIDKFDSK